MGSSPSLFMRFLKTSLILLSFFTISQAEIASCHPKDRAILLQIKAHIKSPDSTRLGSLDTWQPDSNCCFWPFVGCTTVESPHPGRVNGITISGGSGLAGTIPEVIGDLPFLEEIMFFDEPKLTGPLPKSLIKLKNLELIYLNSNSLSGTIPNFLGQLKRLRGIDISDNKFSGVIPPSISSLAKLTSFNVSHNMLKGSVPTMQTLKLKEFDVSFNLLCGVIPSGLRKFDAKKFGHNKCLCGPPLAACK